MSGLQAPSSGAEGLIGYDVDLTGPDATARVTLNVNADHLNRNGTLHGGIHAVLLDAAAGFAASRHIGDETEIIPVVTLSLATSYLAAIVDGQVTAVGRVTGGGRKIIYAEAQLVDAQGAVCSRAQGVFRRAPS